MSLGIRHDFPPHCLLTRTRQSWSCSQDPRAGTLPLRDRLRHDSRWAKAIVKRSRRLRVRQSGAACSPSSIKCRRRES